MLLDGASGVRAAARRFIELRIQVPTARVRDKSSRVITINLDHAVVVAARGLGDDEVAFRRLCHEIAFTAYAVALADLQLERDDAMDASDAMHEVRHALERVWRRAEGLYAA